ncbi:MAG: hypothetical protein C3F02_00065 [Parcubacteria group bacterium]|nr:MAG: hypothetical protein C3F02_00065 [Parcubacteria group bacterium]
MSNEERLRLNVPAAVLVQLIELIGRSEIYQTDSLEQVVIKLARVMGRTNTAKEASFVTSLLKDAGNNLIICRYHFGEGERFLKLTLDDVKILSLI